MQLSTASFVILTMLYKIVSCKSPSISTLDLNNLWKFQAKHKTFDLIPLHHAVLLIGHLINLITIELHFVLHEHQNTIEHFLEKLILSTFDRLIQTKISENLMKKLKIGNQLIQKGIITSMNEIDNSCKYQLYKAGKRQDIKTLLEFIKKDDLKTKTLAMYYLLSISTSITNDKKRLEMIKILIKLSIHEEFQKNPFLKGLLILCLIQLQSNIDDIEIILKNVQISDDEKHFIFFHYLELYLQHNNYSLALTFAYKLKDRNIPTEDLEQLFTNPYFSKNKIKTIDSLILFLETKSYKSDSAILLR